MSDWDDEKALNDQAAEEMDRDPYSDDELDNIGDNFEGNEADY